MPSRVIDEKLMFCDPFSSKVLTCESVIPGAPAIANVNVSSIAVGPPVTSAPKSADAGGVSEPGVGPMMTLAALALVAAPTSATAPAAAKSNLRITNLLFTAQVAWLTGG